MPTLAELDDPKWSVRCDAVKALASNEAALARHSAAIAKKLDDPKWTVRRDVANALGSNEAVLADHSSAIAQRASSTLRQFPARGGWRGASGNVVRARR